MAAQTVTTAPSNSSTALFRAWVTAFINGLTQSGGLVRVAQTGEINEATVNAPGAINTVAGFAVFRSNDATGGLHNWYMKVSFASGTATNYMAFRVQFGWGADGNGNLTGNTNTEVTFTRNDHSASVFNCNLSVGTGWFSFAMFLLSPSNAFFFNVERVRDVNGAVTDDIHAYIPSTLNQVIRYSGTNGTNNTTAGTTIGGGWRHSLTANTTYASNTGVGTLAPQLGGFLPEIMGAFIGDSTNYIAGQSQYTFNVYGGSHTYILNVDTNNNIFPFGYRILSRYE